MEKDFMIFNGSKKFDPYHFSTKNEELGLTKSLASSIILENNKVMADLQDKLYAYKKDAILVVIQAMDAGGKDSMVKNVMSGLNPQATQVYSFKKPSSEELSHDYLWRCSKCLPERGRIGIFNRSYYEDVLISKVHNLPINQSLPDRCMGTDIWEKRYRQIRDYERYLDENGIIVLKFFLHISKEEQKNRFLRRIDNETKNWKLVAADVEERKYWDEYQQAYKAAINATATEHAPWIVVPADTKWYSRLAVSEFIIDTLKFINPQYPVLPKTEQDELQHFKRILSEDK